MKLKWWIKILLLFSPKIMSIDVTDRGYAYVIVKRLFGITYVIESGYVKTAEEI